MRLYIVQLPLIPGIHQDLHHVLAPSPSPKKGTVTLLALLAFLP